MKVRVSRWLVLVPALGGSVHAVLCLFSVMRWRLASGTRVAVLSSWPPVSVLKPVRNLERNLAENLRSACLQDYPEFQVILSVQDQHDSALPLLRALRQEFPDRVTVVVDDTHHAPNGKVRNLMGGLAHARHEILVISDSDVLPQPDYLKTVVAPRMIAESASVRRGTLARLGAETGEE